MVRLRFESAKRDDTTLGLDVSLPYAGGHAESGPLSRCDRTPSESGSSACKHRAGSPAQLPTYYHYSQPTMEPQPPLGTPVWRSSLLHAKDLDLNGHVFPVWPHVLEKILHDASFEVVEYVTLDGKAVWPGRPFSLRYPLRCLVALAMMAIEYFDRLSCGMSYGVAAKLKANAMS